MKEEANKILKDISNLRSSLTNFKDYAYAFLKEYGEVNFERPILLNGDTEEILVYGLGRNKFNELVLRCENNWEAKPRWLLNIYDLMRLVEETILLLEE